MLTLKTTTEYEFDIHDDAIVFRAVERVEGGAVASRTVILKDDGTIEKRSETPNRVVRTKRLEFSPSDFQKIRKALEFFLNNEKNEKEKVWLVQGVLFWHARFYFSWLLKYYRDYAPLE
ncbi:hypothetical protein KEJ32_02505 [Candidatus Bathyarchaeota archaeon]|nr:hypothetical protein [Candidatus Bathyarchaeota archaeon]